MPRELADVEWPVSTPRLTLRRATVDDADAVLSYRGSPLVTEWLGPPPEDFHERFTAPERLELLLIIEREGAIIGDLMVRIGDAWSPPQHAAAAKGVQAELGLVATSGGDRQGVCDRGCRGRRADLLRGPRAPPGTASCFVGNEPSYRLMERIGMRRETHAVKDALHPSGEWMDGYEYALLAEEWRHRHA